MSNQHKVFDASAMFHDAQATTVAAGWTTAATPQYGTELDLGMDNADTWNGGEIIIHWPGITGATATLTFTVCTKATAGATTSEAILSTPAIAIATLAADDEIRIALPTKGVLRYLNIAVTIATANITAGTIHAGLIKN